MIEPVEKVSVRLNNAMHIRHISQAELSEKTKISKASLSQYMNGKICPKQDRIFVLARVLSVDEAWLMGYDVPMDRNVVSKVDFSSFGGTELTDDIKLLIERYMRLDDEGKEHILKTIEFMMK